MNGIKIIPVIFFGVMMVNKASAIDFTYLNGSATTGYTQKGAPTNLIDRSADMPIDVLANIYNMLPESQYVNSTYVDTGLSSNIIADSDLIGYMTVEVSFLNEGAGYRNTVGYFIFDAVNPPAAIDDIAEHVIMFPNASKPSEGELKQGDTVDLSVELTAGQGLGFFVIPNGWGWNGSYGNIDSLGPWGQAFYSLPNLNPEPSNLRNHNVVFYDAANEFFIVGFDDQHRSSGDNDFNDVLFSIKSTPFYAVEGINEDGSVDAASYQVLTQTDTQITSTTYYPSQQEYGTLLFEDLWPVIGDYDFNDLVVNYRLKHTLNNENKLVAMEISYQVQAIGASFNNGFALHLPNVLASNVTSTRLEKDGVLISEDILDAVNMEANLILLSDVRNLVDYSCSKYRTSKNCRESVTNDFKATIQFSQPIDVSLMGEAPYDPYIFAVEDKYHGRWGGREWELHLKQFPGSDAFNTSLFGIEDDATVSPNYFVSKRNFPWVLNVPATWSHALEGIDVSKAYPKLKNWVRSNGELDSDWYLNGNAIQEYLY